MCLAIACYRYYATQARALEGRQGRVIEHDMAGVQAQVFEGPAEVVGLITP